MMNSVGLGSDCAIQPSPCTNQSRLTSSRTQVASNQSLAMVLPPACALPGKAEGWGGLLRQQQPEQPTLIFCVAIFFAQFCPELDRLFHVEQPGHETALSAGS